MSVPACMGAHAHTVLYIHSLTLPHKHKILLPTAQQEHCTAAKHYSNTVQYSKSQTIIMEPYCKWHLGCYHLKKVGVRHLIITDWWEIKVKTQCWCDLQIYEIVIFWKSVNCFNGRSERTHRQHRNEMSLALGYLERKVLSNTKFNVVCPCLSVCLLYSYNYINWVVFTNLGMTIKISLGTTPMP
jgi:hypothetical protein